MLTVILPILQTLLQITIGTRIGCAILAGGIAFLAADIHRARMDELDWQKRAAAYEAAQKARDLEIDHELAAQVAEKTQQLQQAQEANDQLRRDFDASLKPLPAGDTTCRVGDDAGRLRTISGQSEGQRVPRLPKARRLRPTA